MKLPYGYVLIDGEITVQGERADVAHNIFGAYLVGASLGKITDLLAQGEIVSPTERTKWARAVVDKLLANKKYVPVIGVEVYMSAQFKRA